MDEQELRELIGAVKAGRVSRRAFVRRMVGLGLTAPFASLLLSQAGVAQAATRSEYKATKAGGGGALRTLFWQAPTLLNPHFAVGTKDQEGSRMFYEPLAAWDPDGNLVPVLATEIPEIENGGIAPDGMSVTWKLKKDVAWHDGRPFTADDVVFNWEYAADPVTAAVTIGNYQNIKVEKIDPLTVRVHFDKPTPFWAEAFVGSTGMIVPKHLFEAYKGASSRDAPANLKPVGTGPYRFVDFKPGDLVKGERNPNYHMSNRPFFDAIELKGGGDAVSAARAVIQTGEYDFAWNVQVEDEILRRMEQGGRGRVDLADSGNVEHLAVNFSDPWRETDGERSSPKSQHPVLSDPAVRAALALLVDRGTIQEQVYGRLGVATANYLNAPSRFRSPNTRWEFSAEKASQALDQAGWKRGADGTRAKAGKRLRLVFQTSINSARQKTQAILKQAGVKAGIEGELKSILAWVYYSSDPGNPDTIAKFAADVQMYSWQFGVDPQRSMEAFTSWEHASRENKWAGRNTTRWRSEEYDRLWKAAATEMDAAKRAALFIQMNDLVIQNVVVIPILWRKWVSAVGHRLRGTEISGWDSSFWNLAHWYREA